MGGGSETNSRNTDFNPLSKTLKATAIGQL